MKKKVVIENPAQAIDIFIGLIEKAQSKGIFNFVEVDLALQAIRVFDKNYAVPMMEDDSVNETPSTEEAKNEGE